jgi:hypothetical protein
LKSLLEECGYSGSRLREDYRFGSAVIPLVGFATKPLDFDSACVAVISNSPDSVASARSCRNLGAPVVWVEHDGRVDWWMQRAAEPTLFASEPLSRFVPYVRRHKQKLNPVAVYRGKTIARVDKSRQLDFVDAGLLPLLREEAGAKLHDLVEGMIRAMLSELGSHSGSKLLRTVFTAAFRLLAGKILKDKGVHGFRELDLSDPADVLAAVGRHYNARQAALPVTGKWKDALAAAVSQLSTAGSFGVVSPETLAHVYEHTLVTKAVRKKLGIHATPPWLVDYMVWRLYDWIREIPESDRHVFEPACGHAPFLLSAMRLLRLELPERDEAAVHSYLKAHLHGIELDDFAREIARLSLTLADVPNPNGWDLREGDMFASDVLMREATNCRVLLSNPPYEAFESKERTRYSKSGLPVSPSKAIELTRRTLQHLPAGGVFALILPQAVLHGPEARTVRDLLLDHFEVREVCLFADKVFEEGEPESVVLLGRRRQMGAPAIGTVSYRRIHDGGVTRFAETYEADFEFCVDVGTFRKDPGHSFRVPALPELWSAVRAYPPLSNVADVGQGFSFARKGLLELARRSAKNKTSDAILAFLDAHTNVDISALPPTSWLSPSRTPVRPWRSGVATGKPQVLVNYVRAARGPWRVKAFLDRDGCAAINTYLTVRPKPGGPPVEFLWAVLNSPVANAFAYCHTMQKHNYDTLIGALPLPPVTPDRCNAVVSAALGYLAAAEAATSAFMEPDAKVQVKQALLALDAEVLKFYNLPPRLERKLLDVFAHAERKGVGCDFRGYYPSGFSSYLPLHLIISERFHRAAADQTAARFKPGESVFVRDALIAAAGSREE